MDALFEKTGNVISWIPRQRSARWSDETYDFVKEYVASNPYFYIQELQDALLCEFSEITNVSASTICRALRHDFKLSRKCLEKRAKESIFQQLREFYMKLSEMYSYPEQLIFIDESSKDGRDCLRRVWVVPNKHPCDCAPAFSNEMSHARAYNFSNAEKIKTLDSVLVYKTALRSLD
jgi:hypothetical protein